MRCVLSPDPSPLWKLTPSPLLGLYPRLDPSRPRRSRCCARTPRCGASATPASCARFMYVVRCSFVVVAARSCGRERGRILGRCWRGFRRARGAMMYHWLSVQGGGRARLLRAAKMRTTTLEKVIKSYSSKPALVQTCKPTTLRCLAGYPTAQCTPHSHTSPDLIARAHPFGVYVPGTTPGQDGQQGVRSRAAHGCGVRSWPVAGAPGWKTGRYGQSFAESAETGRRCGSKSGNRRGWCARCTFTEAKEGPVRGRGYVPVPVGALEEPDGVKVKSAGMIKDSDLEYLS